jgi:pimeloyl-ACP methyl ester carboxylesterase
VTELRNRVPGRAIWVVTTNDNTDALRFYQRVGFRLREARVGAVDEARRTLKPSIPRAGRHGIPLRDEIELVLLPPLQRLDPYSARSRKASTRRSGLAVAGERTNMRCEGLVDVPGGRIWVQAAGQGSAVVLVQAGIADARMWDPQWDALSSQHHVARYDTRGFGRTETGDVPFSNRADLVAVMDAVGTERATFVGASRGGAIVVDTALEFPDRVTGLVSVCGGLGGLSGPGAEDTPEEVELGARQEALLEAKDWAAAADVDVAWWVDGIGQAAGRAPAAVRASVRQMCIDTYAQAKVSGQPFSLEPRAAGRLAEIRVPMLVIVGELDTPGIHAAADALTAGVTGARRIDIPNVANLPNLERPQWFTETLLAYLAQR